MHVAAVKVLHRANGVDGLPQRMLDAMLAVQATPPAQPAPEQYTALEQALTRLQKRYAELEAKVAAQPAMQKPVAWLKRHELADLQTCNHRRLGADSPRIWAPNAPDAPPPELDLVAVYTAAQPAPKVVDCHATGVCVQSGLRAEPPAAQPAAPLTAWQPIETAPRDGRWVITFDGETVSPNYYLGSEIEHWAKTPLLVNPTHWMPIPTAPDKGGAVCRL
jgi:hypothetical protein